MRVTHFGHSCLLVDIAGRQVLLDPGAFSEDLSAVGDLAAVIVTHQHGEHVDFDRLTGLLERSPQAVLITDPETARIASEKGFDATESSADFVLPLGDGRAEFVGERHAEIYRELPRVTNVGVVLRDADGTTLFHPGDALDAEPGAVDVLAVPVNAPWCAAKETIDFVRRVGPHRVLPIHDALLVPMARAMYLGHIQRFGGDNLELIDLARGADATL